MTVQPLKPATPKIVLPANNAFTNDGTPVLMWGSALYADSYSVQIANNAKFTGATTYNDLGTAFETGALADGKYYWHVQAKNLLGLTSAWSGTSSFTVDTIAPAAPVLSKPLNAGSIVGNPAFSWLASVGATKYQLQYEYTSDGNNDTYDYRSGEITGLKHTATTMPTALSTVYWQVRAEDAAGNWGNWSDSFAVTIQPPVPAAPKLSTPANSSVQTSSTPTLNWGSVAYGENYDIQVNNTNVFTGALIQEYTNVDSTSKVLGTLADGKYFWHVRARNANGNVGAWSSSYSFTIDTTPPAVPSLVSPADNPAGVRTLTTFTWLASATAKYYQFQYDTVANFASPDYDNATLTKTSVTLSASLSANTYYWHVRAMDMYGNWSTWSATRALNILPAVVMDGGFEETNGSWAENSSHNWGIVSDSGLPISTHSGYYLAWLGGGNSETSILTQTGVSMNSARYLHFWYLIGSADYCGYDKAYVLVNGSTIATMNLCKTYSKNVWVHQVIDLGTYTGSTISLAFKVTTDSSFSSSLFVDDVVITNFTDIPANIGPASVSSASAGMSALSVENPLQMKTEK